MEEKKAKPQEVIETEIQMGTVHPAALEPYRVRFFVEDEIVKDAEITIGVNHRGIERIMEGLPVEKAKNRNNAMGMLNWLTNRGLDSWAYQAKYRQVIELTATSSTGLNKEINKYTAKGYMLKATLMEVSCS